MAEGTGATVAAVVVAEAAALRACPRTFTARPCADGRTGAVAEVAADGAGSGAGAGNKIGQAPEVKDCDGSICKQTHNHKNIHNGAGCLGEKKKRRKGAGAVLAALIGFL